MFLKCTDFVQDHRQESKVCSVFPEFSVKTVLIFNSIGYFKCIYSNFIVLALIFSISIHISCSKYVLFFRIITEHKLDSMNIYTHVAKYLVNTDRFMEVKTLAKCIRNSKETAAK